MSTVFEGPVTLVTGGGNGIGAARQPAGVDVNAVVVRPVGQVH